MIRLIFICFFALITCSSASASEFSNISTQRLAGQMVLIGFSGSGKNDYLVKKLSQEASLGKLGGVVFRSQNLHEQTAARELVARFANIAVANPLLLMLDASELEGDFARLGEPALDGSKQSLEQARIAYLKSALEVYEMGFNGYFGPHIFASSDSSRLSVYAQLFSEALAQANLARSVVGFPGVEPAPGRISEEFYLEWMRPFYDAVATQNADIIVLSTKIISPLDPLRPATQSPKIVRMLRNDLGFSGLIASDDILGGDLDSQDFAERIIASINAGCDLLYFSQSIIKRGDTASAVVDIITQAVASGKISRERLEESYAKIMALKAKFRKRMSPES